MHLLIYKLRPDVQGVVHAHPPTATGFAAAGMPLNQPLVCEVVIGLGSIPLAKYGTPGTPELTAALEPLVPQYDAILMSNHGVVAYGADLHHAYMKMETVEHFAQIALVTHLLGRQQPLGSEELGAASIRAQGRLHRSPWPFPSPRKSMISRRQLPGAVALVTASDLWGAGAPARMTAFS
jgi:L-fuculose-phosphate aldolase